MQRSSELAVAQDWIRQLDIRPQEPLRLFRNLSGGNQQKTILAKWFNTDPKAIVLDDPTAGVDVGARQAIYDLIRQRAQLGTAVVVSSSDHEDLLALCTRVLVLWEGRIGVELRGRRDQRGRPAARPSPIRSNPRSDRVSDATTAPTIEVLSNESIAPERHSPFGFRNIGAVYVWIAIVVIFSILEPDTFPTLDTARSILNNNAVTGLITLSVVIPMAAGVFDVSVANIAGFSGVMAAWWMANTSFSPWLAILLTLLIAMMLGVFNALVVVQLRVIPHHRNARHGGDLLRDDEVGVGREVHHRSCPAALEAGGSRSDLGDHHARLHHAGRDARGRLPARADHGRAIVVRDRVRPDRCEAGRADGEAAAVRGVHDLRA